MDHPPAAVCFVLALAPLHQYGALVEIHSRGSVFRDFGEWEQVLQSPEQSPFLSPVQHVRLFDNPVYGYEYPVSLSVSVHGTGGSSAPAGRLPQQ